ncbi:metal ABC transporter permease [uncultured Thiohalocapsa sp.]|uniref:metal ABC transporter permease n=1 Tax=uncultured Thiohalocapsa sp. TaxID=768990 RepID=UPI0025FEF047|nr:metal ABC transporter permease [uncultured Thiohalocapsa sp.]
MDLSLLSDPIFRLPFVVGLLLAIVLPLLGALLMLRDEWLAALGYAHLAAAGALLGLAFGLPALLGGVAAAGAGAAAKGAGGARGNAFYGFMILGGWAALLLLAANTGLGEQLGHALIEGQLYFAGPTDLMGAILLALVAGAGLPWLMPRLLRARLLPQHEVANALPARRWHLGFDLLAAAGMAVGTASLGLMAAFALVLAPAWIAFRMAPGWGWTLVWCTAVGALAYVVAFAAALALDQPFAPVLVAVLLAAAAGGAADRALRVRGAATSPTPSAQHPAQTPKPNQDNGEPSP